MISVDLIRAGLVALAAGCLYLDLHPITVFVLATSPPSSGRRSVPPSAP